MGKDPVLDKVVVGIYPYTKADSMNTYIELASNMSGLDELWCGHSHRKGPFCAICKDGYGPSINSLFPKCVKCKHSKSSYYWVFYILVEVVATSHNFLFRGHVVSHQCDPRRLEQLCVVITIVSLMDEGCGLFPSLTLGAHAQRGLR